MKNDLNNELLAQLKEDQALDSQKMERYKESIICIEKKLKERQSIMNELQKLEK